MNTNVNKMALLGDSAPSFKATTTSGEVNFPEDYKGKWVILFSHPGDFTPVCTTEFITFELMRDEFADLNVELLGLSVDSLASHIAWLQKIKELEYNGYGNIDISFPIIVDSKMEIASLYGMIQPNQSTTHAIRAVFIIDPNGIIRTILYYPLTTGRNFHELKRIIMALQTTDRDKVATPANWRPGDDVIIPIPNTYENSKKRIEFPDAGMYCLDWFMCFKKNNG